MFCYSKFEGYPYSGAGFEKVRKGKLIKLLNSISELISKVNILEI